MWFLARAVYKRSCRVALCPWAMTCSTLSGRTWLVSGRQQPNNPRPALVNFWGWSLVAVEKAVCDSCWGNAVQCLVQMSVTAWTVATAQSTSLMVKKTVIVLLSAAMMSLRTSDIRKKLNQQDIFMIMQHMVTFQKLFWLDFCGRCH